MQRTLVVCVVLAALVASPGVLLAQEQAEPAEKKTIAVMPFEYGTIQKWWGEEQVWDIGRGISDMLIEELLESGQYRLMERSYLETLLAEQEFTESDRANPGAASQLGRMLNVDAIIVGSVTQFGTEEKKRGVFGGIAKAIPVIGAIGGIGQKKGIATVAVTARIVDVATGEVLASTTGEAESERSGLILGGLGVGGDTIAGGGISMTSSDFRQTILGEATTGAVEALARKLGELEHRVSHNDPVVNGYIADVVGATVVLNVGAMHGLGVGDELVVERVVRVVVDPTTKEPLREITEVIGRIRIDDVDDRSSLGTIVEGEDIRVEDKVTNRNE